LGFRVQGLGSRVQGLGFGVWGVGFPTGCSVSRVQDALEMCSGSETVAYLRLIDSCITQLKAQGPSRTCNESKEEEEEDALVIIFCCWLGLRAYGLGFRIQG